MPVAPTAELVWCAVAGIHADELFVIDSADYIGSTAPSRRHSRSLGTLFQVGYAFVDEQFVFLASSSWCVRGLLAVHLLECVFFQVFD